MNHVYLTFHRIQQEIHAFLKRHHAFLWGGVQGLNPGRDSSLPLAGSEIGLKIFNELPNEATFHHFSDVEMMFTVSLIINFDHISMGVP
jgi:hypothetical protein